MLLLANYSHIYGKNFQTFVWYMAPGLERQHSTHVHNSVSSDIILVSDLHMSETPLVSV